jgi:chromosome segregation ATPase
MEDLNKLMAELMAAHRETEHHVVRMIERQSDIEAMMVDLKKMMGDLKSRNGQLEALTKQVAENNIRISRILEVHDYNIDELDARLKRLEERRRNGGPQ